MKERDQATRCKHILTAGRGAEPGWPAGNPQAPCSPWAGGDSPGRAGSSCQLHPRRWRQVAAPIRIATRGFSGVGKGSHLRISSGCFHSLKIGSAAPKQPEWKTQEGWLSGKSLLLSWLAHLLGLAKDGLFLTYLWPKNKKQNKLRNILRAMENDQSSSACLRNRFVEGVS